MSDYFDRVERQLVAKVEAGLPRRSRFPVRLDHLAVAASLLVVIAVGAVFISVRGSRSADSPAGARATTIVFSASPLALRAPLGPSIAGSIRILRQRLDSGFGGGVRVFRAGSNVVIAVPEAAAVTRGQIAALAVPARLEFYDWEANALTPNGMTVASQLLSQNPTALQISQGGGSAAPGEPGAGSLPLYQAVKLASKQPPLTTLDASRSGPQYYLFGAPGSTTCKTAARDQGEPVAAGVHCLLSGPDRDPQALDSDLPAGVSASQGHRLEVPAGMIVLQAANLTPNPTPISSPAARFYVLKDNIALSDADITNPQQSTDSGGSPDVKFGLNSAGATEFQKLTEEIARRGDAVSGLGQIYDQHFAIALDDQLVTVPSIDFKIYPDGITPRQGADITGAFTKQSARTLATLLRYGPLSVNLAAH
jgi:SecD/SecF fusion protein